MEYNNIIRKMVNCFFFIKQSKLRMNNKIELKNVSKPKKKKMRKNVSEI